MIKRYAFLKGVVFEHPTGRWVDYADYAILLSQHRRNHKQYMSMVSVLEAARKVSWFVKYNEYPGFPSEKLGELTNLLDTQDTAIRMYDKVLEQLKVLRPDIACYRKAADDRFDAVFELERKDKRIADLKAALQALKDGLYTDGHGHMYIHVTPELMGRVETLEQQDQVTCEAHGLFPCRECGTKHFPGCQCSFCR